MRQQGQVGWGAEEGLNIFHISLLPNLNSCLQNLLPLIILTDTSLLLISQARNQSINSLLSHNCPNILFYRSLSSALSAAALTKALPRSHLLSCTPTSSLPLGLRLDSARMLIKCKHDRLNLLSKILCIKVK